ncbi:MAG: hypothetical protein Q9213_007437 [Squamulea squamosa]
MGSTRFSSLNQLADTIKASTLILDEHLNRHGHPDPSLGVDGVPISLACNETGALAARDALLTATHDLRNLVLGPVGILMSIGANEVMCLQTIYRYKIASSFGIYEQPSFQEVSAVSGLNVMDLQRILRYAMTNHIFCEPRPGFIAHTATSRLMAENPLMHDFVGNVCEIRFPASARAVDALEKYGESQAPNQSGFSLFNNTALGLYDELAHNTELSRRWDGAMSALALQIDFDFILNSFPWTSYANPLILDVGGGRGDVSIGLKAHLPNARFIVQDASDTARKQGECISACCGAEITYEYYDFRTPQPIHGADIYYFRNIFHNWPDKSCIDILRNQIPSLKENAMLVIDDFTLHEPGTLSGAEERQRRWMDINMLVFFGSHERTVEEWRNLLNAADPRFKLVNISRAPNKPNTILQVAWTNMTS